MLNELQHLKIKILSRGIKISKKAREKLTSNGKVPLSLFEYPTTAGISLILPKNIYVNGQFVGKFSNSNILLDYNSVNFILKDN